MNKGPTSTIGTRIQDRRKTLGLTVRRTADLAGINPSTLSRIERGERSADNRFVIAAIAEALRCPVSDLTGQLGEPTTRAAAEAAASTREVVRAAIDADLRDGPLTADAPPIEQLARDLELVSDLKMRCDYAGARSRLPALILGLHSAAYGPDRERALLALVAAHQEASSVVRYSDDPEGACLVAERAQQAAETLDDPVMLGLAAFARAHAASGCGQYARASRIAERATEGLQRHLVLPHAVEMLGMLHLTAAYCRYPLDGSGVDARLAEAERLAECTGQSSALNLMFGPENVKLWRIAMQADGSTPERAVEVARRTTPQLVPSRSRQTAYFLDTGRALAHMGKDTEALRMLIVAERMSPQRVRMAPLVAETARDMLERSRRSAGGSELRGLCSRLGVA